MNDLTSSTKNRKLRQRRDWWDSSRKAITVLSRFFVPPICQSCHQPLIQRDAVCARAVAHYTGAMRHLIHISKYADYYAPRQLFKRWLLLAGNELSKTAISLLSYPSAAKNWGQDASIRPPSQPRNSHLMLALSAKHKS